MSKQLHALTVFLLYLCWFYLVTLSETKLLRRLIDNCNPSDQYAAFHVKWNQTYRLIWYNLSERNGIRKLCPPISYYEFKINLIPLHFVKIHLINGSYNPRHNFSHSLRLTFHSTPIPPRLIFLIFISHFITRPTIPSTLLPSRFKARRASPLIFKKKIICNLRARLTSTLSVH